MKGSGWRADPHGFATRIKSSGFAPPGFLLRACRPCAARRARPANPPDSLKLPGPPEPRLAGGWSSVPTAAPLGASGASRWPGGPAVTWPRSARRGPRSSAGLSLASRVKPGLQEAPGPGPASLAAAREGPGLVDPALERRSCCVQGSDAVRQAGGGWTLQSVPSTPTGVWSLCS